MKEEVYSVGDIVVKTAMYAANYPTWKIEKGIVLSVKKRVVLDKSLGATDRVLYVNRYGRQEKYPLFEMIISTTAGDYLVSQFGFSHPSTNNS